MSGSYFFLKKDTLTKNVDKISLENQVNAANIITEEVKNIIIRESDFILVFDGALSDVEHTELNRLVAAHEHITSAQSVQNYLSGLVEPFIEDLIQSFLAENIVLGITQAGQTDGVLGLFEDRVDIGAIRPVSLKGCFDTASLYSALKVLDFHRENIEAYSSLQPFVTGERLLDMKNKIKIFLGQQ